MRKATRFLSLIFLSALLISSCGKEAEGDNEVSANSPEISETIEENIIAENNDTSSSDNLLDYFTLDEIMEKYVEYLKLVYEDRTTDSLRYYLAYINADEVPELLYMEDSSHLSGVHVCVCDKNGDIYDVGEFGEYGNFSYLPKSGKILSYYMNSGCYFSDFYKLEGCSIRDLAYFEIDSDSEGDNTTRYYVDGDEVDQETYSSKYNLVKGSGLLVMNYDGTFSFNDTEDILFVLKTYANTGVWPALVDISNSINLIKGEWELSEICFSTDSEYEASDALGLASKLIITEDGNVTISIANDEKSVADNDMVINTVKMDFADPEYAYVGCNNYYGTRKYYIFTGANDRLTVLMNDYSGEFQFDYFNAIFVRSEGQND